MRKPLVTAIIEKIIMIAAGALMAVYVNQRLMEQDIHQLHIADQEMRELFNKQVLRRDVQMAAERKELMDKLNRIEYCIMVRTCTK